MKLYNTLTKQIDEIEPLNPPQITIYTCGPTVYDYAHIGHWFNYVRMDTLIRTLKANDFNTKWVMNITDVGHLTSDADEGEDKLEKGAKREGKTAWEIADFYTKDFLDGMKQLNMLEPNHIVKATDHIPEQVELIKRLEEKGFTYIISDGVYYETSKFEGYAAFAQLDLDGQEAGARLAINPQKHSPTDFALWKFSPQDSQRDMEWDSPWGKGFPGWHIECSAMSMKYLGETLDIHTGGIDHIPVHHTNEIAQSEAATGKRFANHWMHSNHIMVNGRKISKSLDNSIRLKEVTDRGISPMAVRLHVLESHYRSQSMFNWENLEASQNTLKNFYAWADLQFQSLSSQKLTTNYDEALIAFKEAMSDDLKTPVALTIFSDMTNRIEDLGADSVAISKTVPIIEGLLGIGLSDRPDITGAQKSIIAERETSRADKDWVKSDKLRDQLAKEGIGLRDTAQGPIWFRL